MQPMNFDKIIEAVLVLLFGIVGDGFILFIGTDSNTGLPAPIFWMVLVGFNGAIVGLLAYVKKD